MALSLLKQPAELIMAYQPVVFSLLSTATGTPLRIAGGVYGIGGDSVQAGVSKKATFEFSDYLQGLITERGKTAATPMLYDEVPKIVTFIFQEQVGDPIVTMPELETDIYFLLDGCIPKSRRKAFYASYTHLLAFLKSSKSCLSWWPDNEPKNVLPDQKEFINFLQVNSVSIIPLKQNLSLSFTDGTSVDCGSICTVNAAYMKLVYFPTGFTQLGISLIMAQAYPDKKIAGYSICVKTGSSLISKIYSYTLDTSWHQNPRYLYIKNPFGLLEVLLCTGISQQENAIKPESVVTDGQSLPDKITWKSVKSDVVKVNTGFLTAAQMQWLSDLLDSTEAYELIHDNLHPIVFRDIILPVVHDGEFQYSADLEYEYAYNEVIEQG
ncbi:MAG: hypothetical protein WCR72_09395 [Bacteroidota bacterium]